jgi:opacity protein-like surface antigen
VRQGSITANETRQPSKVGEGSFGGGGRAKCNRFASSVILTYREFKAVATKNIARRNVSVVLVPTLRVGPHVSPLCGARVGTRRVSFGTQSVRTPVPTQERGNEKGVCVCYLVLVPTLRVGPHVSPLCGARHGARRVSVGTRSVRTSVPTPERGNENSLSIRRLGTNHPPDQFQTMLRDLESLTAKRFDQLRIEFID